MHTVKIEHKYHSGDIVYFLAKNEVRKGIVSRVIIDIRTVGFSDGHYVTRLFKNLITNFNKERRYEKNLCYQIDLLDKNKNEYHSTPHYFDENKLFFSKSDLIKNI